MTPTIVATSLIESPIVLAGLVTIVLALIAGLQLIVVTRTNASVAAAAELRAAKIRAEEKAEDWRRQDAIAARAESQAAQRAEKVADQAEKAAELLRKAQQETIERTEQVARTAAENDAKMQQQLHALDEQGKANIEQGKKIHILVNSDMTAARTNERDSMKVTLLAIKKIKALNEVAGVTCDPEDDDEIERVTARILELDQILADRHAAQQVVDAEAAAAGEKPIPPSIH